jgi:hypothetical protein
MNSDTILTVPLIFLLRKGPPCNYMGEAETPGFIPGGSFFIPTF